MGLSLRQLTSNDSEKYKYLIADAPKILGHIENDVYLTLQPLSTENINVYGIFSDNELVASVAIKLWKSLPYFSFLRLVVKKNNFKKSQHIEIYQIMAKSIITEMLSKKRTSFFYAMKKSHFYSGNFKKVDRSWTAAHVPIFNLFQFNFEHFYDGIEDSEFSTIRSFVRFPQKKEMLLRRGTLKPIVFKELFIDHLEVEVVVNRFSQR